MPLDVVAMFVDLALKGTVLLAVAFMLVRALQNAPAAARHLVWSVALVGVLVIPALSRTIPWKLEVLPAIESAALVETPSPDRATSADGAEALGAGTSVGAADTDRAQVSRGESLETEGTATAATGTWWQLPKVQQLLSWVPLIWLLGVGVLSVRIALSLGAIRWMAWRGVSANPADWHDELGAARRVLGLVGPVRLVVSRRASVPFTTGLWRPVIVLPPASAAWDRGLRRAVLLHELSHVKRRDVLTHFVSQVGCALYWFHPLMWMAAKRLRVESERACDELVLNSGERPTDYAAHLLSIVREALQRRTPALALPMARYAGLEERLDAILEFDGRLRSLSRSGAGLIVTMMVLAVVPLSALAPALDAEPELSVPPTSVQAGESLGLRAGSSSPGHTSLDVARLYLRLATVEVTAVDRRMGALDADALISEPVSVSSRQIEIAAADLVLSAPLTAYQIRGRFGPRPEDLGRHLGIDLIAAEGTPVLAGAGGTVSFTGIVLRMATSSQSITETAIQPSTPIWVRLR